MKAKIKIYGMNKRVLPKEFYQEAACMDLCCTEDVQLRPGEFRYISTGIKTVMPKGTNAHIYGRSSLPKKKHLMFTGTGIIDSDYRGEIAMPIFNFSEDTVAIRKYERIGQIQFQQMIGTKFDGVDYEFLIEGYDKVEELYPSERGSGGLGSTGK